MKIVVFGSQRRVGLWEDDTVIDINNAAAAYLARDMSRAEAEASAAVLAPSNLLSFVAAGDKALELARAAAAHVKGSQDGSLVLPQTLAKLRAPWLGRRIFCLAVNYGQHVADAQTNFGNPMTREDVEAQVRAHEPEGFTKTPIDAVDPEESVAYPARTTQLDYEGELAVVIGRRGKDIPLAEAKDYIWGVTLANDLSVRDGTQFTKHPASLNLVKNFDGCIPIGPCVIIGEDAEQGFDIVTTVNGETRQDYNTRDMIYSFAEFISYLSKDYTLAPGDVIMAGTGTGTAADQTKRHPDATPVNLDLFLKAGDVVEITSPKIGTLRNTIIPK
jgi:2-keto-4-pentenoate hydratase/2-oxohepta-3-ene-1,7-dioic acid hydratase in catechol pathway